MWSYISSRMHSTRVFFQGHWSCLCSPPWRCNISTGKRCNNVWLSAKITFYLKVTIRSLLSYMLFIYREKIKGWKAQFINAQDRVSLNFEIQKNNRKLIDSMTERPGININIYMYGIYILNMCYLLHFAICCSFLSEKRCYSHSFCIVICYNERARMQHHYAFVSPVEGGKQTQDYNNKKIWTFLGDKFNFFAIWRSSLKIVMNTFRNRRIDLLLASNKSVLSYSVIRSFLFSSC